MLTAWNNEAEKRYLADLRPAEVARALRALSSAYVERRHAVPSGLDSAGKRAAFALYYAPLHFAATAHVVNELGAAAPPPHTIVDLGCGTGAAGAAWARAAGGTSMISGIDRHPWAVSEARWTYRVLGLHGQARAGDAAAPPRVKPGAAIVAAYLLNELAPEPRRRLEDRLLDAAAQAHACSCSNRSRAPSRRGGPRPRRASWPPAAAPTSGSSRRVCRRRRRCSAKRRA
jgi:hypothetical protein